MKGVLIFGIVAGSVWSFVPGTLGELFITAGQTATVVFSEALTGVFVSWLLALALPRVSRSERIVLGLFSLPVGAFSFGVIISFIHLAVEALFGISYRFVAHEFMPIHSGFSYAAYSTLWYPVFVLLPLALFTSWLFGRLAVNVRVKTSHLCAGQNQPP